MKATIMEALLNAQCNFKSFKAGAGTFVWQLAEEQLGNAITLLERGYPLDQSIDQLFDKYGDLESIPNHRDI